MAAERSSVERALRRLRERGAVGPATAGSSSPTGPPCAAWPAAHE
ncbi:hypothetical protein ACFQX7_21865 [Luedemannella flava]